MAGFKFVGSQDRIEIPEGSQVVEISSLIPFTFTYNLWFIVQMIWTLLSFTKYMGSVFS